MIALTVVHAVRTPVPRMVAAHAARFSEEISRRRSRHPTVRLRPDDCSGIPVRASPRHRMPTPTTIALSENLTRLGRRNVTIKSSLLISLDSVRRYGICNDCATGGSTSATGRSLPTAVHGSKANEGDMTGLPLSDRKRLAALLGMLGSTSSGERDNAARLAEQLRRRLGLTWEDLLALDHADETAPTRREDQPEPIRPRREKPPWWGYQQALRPADQNSYTWSRVVFVVLTCGTMFAADLATDGTGPASIATWLVSAQSVDRVDGSAPTQSLPELLSMAERVCRRMARTLQKK